MIIRVGETRWANLFDVREITISHVKTLGSEEVKFCVHIDSDSESYDTDPIDTKEAAIDVANRIAEQLNLCAKY